MEETQQLEVKEQKVITSIDQINKIIKSKDATYASHYMIPSLGREVPFNEINTSQQKRIVKSVIDSPLYNTEFIYTLREILKENCQDKDVDIDSLNIIDKLLLALAIRAKCIGTSVEVEVETKEKLKVNVELNIPDILKVALETVQNIKPAIIEDAYFKIECDVISIGDEYIYEKEMHSGNKNIDMEDVVQLREMIGDMYIGEIVKYIKNVQVKDEDDELVSINWDKSSFKKKIKILESFKTGILKEVIKYADSVSKELNKIELVKFNFGGTEYEKRLTIDSNFFTIS